MCRYTGNTQPSLAIGTLARGTCTDETFLSDECPQFCLTGDAMSNGNFIQNCNNGTGCCKVGGVGCSCVPGQPYALDFGSVNVIDSKSVVPLLKESSSTSSTSSTASTTSSSTTTASSFNTQTATTAIASETAEAEPNALSSGAKIGIGVGSAVAALIIGCLAAYLLAKRRKQQRADRASYTTVFQDKQSSGLTAFSELDNTGMPVEKHGNSASLLYEMEGRELPRELPGDRRVQGHEIG